MAVILEVSEFQNPDRWLWRLKDAAGTYLASHQVNLIGNNSDTCGYAGYHDLTTFLERYSPGWRESKLVARVGRWMGEQVLGGLRPKLRKLIENAGGKLAVRIVAPLEAQELILRPLELAWLDEGKSLAEAGARIVWEYGDGAGKLKPKKADGPLRVLGVFSLPTDASPLNLRKERVAFKRLLDTLAATKSLGIETRVLQYGTTKDALRAIINEAPGWDIIHFSCHGAKGVLILEDEKGEADEVPAEKLAELLRTTRPRLKLVVLSACWSGAGLTLEEARQQLGLEPKPEAKPDDQTKMETMATKMFPSLAQDLAKRLDCATLAMRYPVGDEFAIELAKKLFHELLHDRQPLPEALQLALDHVIESDGHMPALSPITPMLVGPRAAALEFAPPKAKPDFHLKEIGLLKFPAPPVHFVGRVGPMLRASRALAPESGLAGVLFHGMAGGGKTACALELAWLHEHGRFQGFIWFKCPDEGEDIQTAMLNFLEDMARQLGMEPGALIANVDNPAEFQKRTAPMLKQFFGKNVILVVIDNMESLLSRERQWLDEKWGYLLDALLAPDGLSRAVLTSRQVPIALAGRQGLLIENVTALSLSESLLLARELPNLRALHDDAEDGLGLFRDAIEVLQGHPKLIELADALAKDREQFADMVRKAREAAKHDGAPLHAFLEAGESTQDIKTFRKAFDNWTHGLVRTLPPTARLLFAFLCRIEDEDRQDQVIKAMWPHFLKRLGEDNRDAVAALAEPDAGLEAALHAIVNSGLAARVIRKGIGVKIDVKTKKPERKISEVLTFEIHPGVAEAGRETVDPIVRDAADWELGDFCQAHYARGMETELVGGGHLIVEAGRRAVPYLLRTSRWGEAAGLIERIIARDPSPTIVLWAIPILQRITEETQRAKGQGLLAMALTRAGRYEEAELLLRDVIAQCESSGEWRGASATAGGLLNVLRALGRFAEALEWAEKKIAFSRKAGLGPWTQISDEGQRLQVLNAMGRWEEVLETVQAKRAEMANLSEQSEANEAVDPWNVREGLLDTGHTAALGLQAWETALELNEEILESKRQRGADAHELARKQFNDYGPLLRLNRFDPARRLLDHCRRVFETERDYMGLGKCYSALADLENKEGQPANAARFEEIALKYTYHQIGEPEDCASSHSNYANYIKRMGEARSRWLPHSLAAGLIYIQVGSGHLPTTVHNLALSDLPTVPPTFDQIADAVEQVNGVKFRALFAKLPKTYPNGDAALAALWQVVQEEKAKRGGILESLPAAVRAALEARDMQAFKEALDALPEAEREEIEQRLETAGILGVRRGPDMGPVLREFEPFLAAIAALALGAGDSELRTKVEGDLDRLEKGGWRLRDAARRICAGERDAEALCASVDPNSAMLIRRILELLEQFQSQQSGGPARNG